MNLQERISALAIRIAKEIKIIKTSLATFYTKAEVDTKLSGKADKSSTYTKTETDTAINTKLAGVYRPKGSKPKYVNLPTVDNQIGDVWNIEETGMNYAWVGGTGGELTDGWDALGGIVDLSGFYTKAESDDKYVLNTRTITAGTGLTGGGSLIANRTLAVNFGTAAGTVAQGNDVRFHTHSNKTVLDETTASFTTTLKSKLDGMAAGANNYSLPMASTTTLGGIKVGANLAITADGILNATNTNTTYTTGTKTIIDAGVETVGKLWDAKVLKDAIVEHGGKNYTAGANISISASNVISAVDTVYTHPITAGNKHIPTGGAVRNYLKYSASGTAIWSLIDETDVESNTDYVALFEANLV
ncbi:head fiber protein [Myroides odoratus]|uniref:head fiber protein n=1 Tax=Myroides odoratus TaxID=256 RepID=UPI00076582F2|nr:head fiber protein [Myroides odoratus]